MRLRSGKTTQTPADTCCGYGRRGGRSCNSSKVCNLGSGGGPGEGEEDTCSSSNEPTSCVLPRAQAVEASFWQRRNERMSRSTSACICSSNVVDVESSGSSPASEEGEGCVSGISTCCSAVGLCENTHILSDLEEVSDPLGPPIHSGCSLGVLALEHYAEGYLEYTVMDSRGGASENRWVEADLPNKAAPSVHGSALTLGEPDLPLKSALSVVATFSMSVGETFFAQCCEMEAWVASSACLGVPIF